MSLLPNANRGRVNPTRSSAGIAQARRDRIFHRSLIVWHLRAGILPWSLARDCEFLFSRFLCMFQHSERGKKKTEGKQYLILKICEQHLLGDPEGTREAGRPS